MKRSCSSTPQTSAVIEPVPRVKLGTWNHLEQQLEPSSIHWVQRLPEQEAGIRNRPGAQTRCFNRRCRIPRTNSQPSSIYTLKQNKMSMKIRNAFITHIWPSFFTSTALKKNGEITRNIAYRMLVTWWKQVYSWGFISNMSHSKLPFAKNAECNYIRWSYSEFLHLALAKRPGSDYTKRFCRRTSSGWRAEWGQGDCTSAFGKVDSLAIRATA